MRTRPNATCHPERQHYAKGLCAYCYKRNLYATSPKAKAKQLETSRRKWRKNRDHILAKQRGYYAANREYRRKQAYGYALARKFGLTAEAHAEMLASQNGSCAICLALDAPGQRLHVDHCHKTGRIRGLLCARCNLGIGRFEDDKTILESAVRYLSR
jgi:recombination endonuclease VII